MFCVGFLGLFGVASVSSVPEVKKVTVMWHFLGSSSSFNSGGGVTSFLWRRLSLSASALAVLLSLLVSCSFAVWFALLNSLPSPPLP